MHRFDIHDIIDCKIDKDNIVKGIIVSKKYMLTLDPHNQVMNRIKVNSKGEVETIVIYRLKDYKKVVSSVPYEVNKEYIYDCSCDVFDWPNEFNEQINKNAKFRWLDNNIKTNVVKVEPVYDIKIVYGDLTIHDLYEGKGETFGAIGEDRLSIAIHEGIYPEEYDGPGFD